MTMIMDKIKPLPAGQVSLQGPLGDSLRLSIENRLKKVDYGHLVEPFKLRNERDQRWRCEFWGKIVRSAILSWRGRPDDELLALIKGAVAGLAATQTPDGCISSYPAELQTQDWDIWGRKYAFLGLIRYYGEIEPAEPVKAALVRGLDHLMSQVGPGAKNIVACGWWDGLAASSVLEPVVLIYRITGERRFLDYAQWIADQGGSTVNNIFTAILQGTPVRELGNGKAYEMMSCFEGLAELYRETGKAEYLNAVTTFYRAVRDQEIFITGGGGLKDEWGEFWDHGKLKQTQANVGALGETCVTTTWLKLCGQVLRLTGEAAVVDEMERALYNGVLGGMVPDGSWWMHRNPTPLAGSSSKIRAGDQIPGYGEDCCVAQGPTALALAPWLAVMQDARGVVVNLYEAATATVTLADGLRVNLVIAGDFPRSEEVVVTVSPDRGAHFAVRLRIPAWSRQTRVSVNGREAACSPGNYLALERAWSPGDVIRLKFDLRFQAHQAPDGGGRVALTRGPVVLAQDSRLGPVDAPLSLERLDAAVLEPCPHDGIHLLCRLADGTALCDYASAGNGFNETHRLCVWMPVAATPR